MTPEMTQGGPWIVASTYERGGFRVVALAGEIDAATAPQLRALLLEQLEPVPHLLVVDLSGVGFADSSALGALVAGRRHAGDIGGMLRIAVPAGHRVARTLGMIGLDRLFEVYPDVAAAVEMPIILGARPTTLD